METVEESVRQAHDLSKLAKKRVKNDFETAYERTKTVLDNWSTMRIMDIVWTAKETEPDRHPTATLKPYFVAGFWLFALFFFASMYYVDEAALNASIVWYFSIRLAQIGCVTASLLCLLCCFEQGVNLVLGTMFMVSLFWSAPPRKRRDDDRKRYG